MNCIVPVNVKIHNAPLKFYKYTVVRRAEDGTLWYYGTYIEKDRAEKAMTDIDNGILLEVITE